MLKTLFLAIFEALKKGDDLVLCSIVASSGSTPRGSGAKMAVFADGTTLGTIGGGAIEFESTKLAVKALLEKKTLIKSYDLTKNDTADIGMICGGKVVVYFQFFKGGDEAALEIMAYINGLFDREVDTWLITNLGENQDRQLSIYEAGKGLLFGEGISADELKSFLKSRGILKKDEPSYYVEPLTQTGTVYIFGGGHVAQELAPVISHVGFRVIVFEDRAEFASQELFKAAVGTILGDFKNIYQSVSLTPNDYVVIMTRGHQADYDVLEQVMRRNVHYVGVIGSRHKKALTFKRLVDAGISEAALECIHSPIGMDIKGETPAEIAISIAGELIRSRAEKNEVEV